jgi:glycosyltransferase involved in cell wall biosynthesis
MDENKISVVIHTYNEENSLGEILEYVKGFDEILVCDMESTDNTVKIAEKSGCRVITFPKENHTIPEPARDFAIHSAKYPWVFVIDADEIVPEKLKDYLYKYISGPNTADGLFIARKNYIMNCFVKNSYPDYQLRFFKRDKAYWPPYVHSKPQIDGTTEKIPSSDTSLALIHKSMTLQTKLRKLNTYTSNEIARRKGEKVNILKIFVKCTFRFIQHYIFRGGIFQGISGLVLSVNEANYKFYTLAKIWEHNNEEKMVDNK